MDLILSIIIAVIVVVILFHFVKNMIALFAAGAMVFFLFNIFFVWSGSDIVDTLHLDKILSDSDVVIIEEWFDNFSNKREEHSVMDTEAISENTKKLLIDGKNKVVEKYNETDKQKMIEELKLLFKGLKNEEIDNIIVENKDLLNQYGIQKSDLIE